MSTIFNRIYIYTWLSIKIKIHIGTRIKIPISTGISIF